MNLTNVLTRPGLRRVPEVTALFWVTKILTTAMGEATSDYFVFRINPYLAVMGGAIVLAIALSLQLSVRRYIPWVYWLTVAMVAVFGTMAADVLHISLGVPYIASTGLFAITLTVIFVLWQKTEGTLSIHSIYNTRRELFYWATVMATFALGTAAGDMVANTLGFGYFTSGLIFAGLIVIPAFAYWKFHLGEIAAFWIAYVLTRPLGASFADWFGKSTQVGGLGWGDGPVALVLTLLIAVCVGYMIMSPKEAVHENRRTAA